jgi:hypothetical protein
MDTKNIIHNIKQLTTGIADIKTNISDVNSFLSMLTIALEKKKKKLVKEDRDICRLLSYIT